MNKFVYELCWTLAGVLGVEQQVYTKTEAELGSQPEEAEEPAEDEEIKDLVGKFNFYAIKYCDVFFCYSKA